MLNSRPVKTGYEEDNLLVRFLAALFGFLPTVSFHECPVSHRRYTILSVDKSLPDQTPSVLAYTTSPVTQVTLMPMEYYVLTFKAYWLRDAPTGLTFNNCTICPHCIYVFCIYLRTNSDLCHLQHKLIGFYNRDEKCLQRGTDWVFK